MKKLTPFIKMLILVSIFFLCLFGWYGYRLYKNRHAMQPGKGAATLVTARKATSIWWQPYLATIGNLKAVNGINLTPEIAGIIEAVNFESGQDIEKGATIVKLHGEVEEANLNKVRAQVVLAKANYAREQTLFKRHVTSQATLDQRYAELQEAQANLTALQAQINQKQIRAPFAGRLGLRTVSLGQYVSPGTSIVTLQSEDPILVEFNIPEADLTNVYISQPIEVNANIGKPIKIIGKITAMNAALDQETRNIKVEATIPNTNKSLIPGMYAWVNISLKNKTKVLTIPENCISYSLNGDYIYTVSKNTDNDSLTAHRVYIKVGEHRDGEAVVLSGIKEGDVVVTDGQLKLEDGASVTLEKTG